MKKIFSKQFSLLVIVIIASSFISCSEDDGISIPNPSPFSINFNGNVTVSDHYVDQIRSSAQFSDNSFSFFTTYPMGYFYITFPYDVYGTVEPSFFHVGYDDFDNDAVYVKWQSYEIGSMGDWDGTYISGTASVEKVNNESITLNFNNYKVNIEKYGETRYIILNGKLRFDIYICI